MSRSTLIALLLVSCTSMAPPPADAQTVYLGGRVGANVESTDPGNGTSVGFGGSFGFTLGGQWRLDIEGWVPRYITDEACLPDPLEGCGPGQFRDPLLGVSVVRSFGGEGIRPYVLAGAAKLWNQQIAFRPDGSQVRWTRSESVYPQAGAGLEIPLAGRLILAPEVRVDFLFLGGIVRPSVGLIYRLH